jgi:hypothetical protein
MHGNVQEWCSDWMGDYPEGAVSDPTGPKEGEVRILRGGCWFYDAEWCESTHRIGNWPSKTGGDFESLYYINGARVLDGFRVALSPSEIPNESLVRSESGAGGSRHGGRVAEPRPELP